MATTEHDHIDAVRDRLGTAFPQLPRPTIDETITSALAQFDGRSIRDFVPLLVERKAREMLRSKDDSQKV
ncbi:three-helix bundle dimerization domain-containing protein [Rhodococcus sp. 077-4]|uniref:three-helix bundle dimerization domain-containing protein n=1 Tax=Rhodococcus sp. 077-4 TaxID=2789271 RepID=UPI0039F4AE12